KEGSRAGLPRKLSWPADFDRDGAFRLRRGTIIPARVEGKDPAGLILKGVLPCFCTEEARPDPDVRSGKLVAAPLQIALELKHTPGTLPGDFLEIEMAVEQVADPAGRAQPVRLGALRLEVAAVAPDQGQVGRLRFGFRADPVM